ncbi:MAG: glycosyltransferase family 2 protein [Promethearchaeota archaeon]
MSKTIVSVIIPTYKRNTTLERAIKSVLNQTMDNLEIIVVDDNDEKSKYRKLNEKLMSKYRNNNKIIYLKHKTNLNAAVARNTGISYSSSKYIAFLDDDDEFLEKKLELQINLLEKLDNSWGAVYCGYSKYRNNKLNSTYLNLSHGNLKIKLLLMENPIAAGSTLLIRRAILNELNGFDITFLRHQDWELLMRFFKKYKIAYVNQNLVKINIDDNVVITNSENLIVTKEKFLKKYEKDIKNLPINLQKEIYKRHYLEITRSFLRNKNIKRAVIYFKKSKNYSRISLIDYVKLGIALIDSIITIKDILLEKIMKILKRNNFSKLFKAFSR